MAGRRGRPSPADQVKQFERQHGITSDQRKKGSARAALAVVAFLLVGVVLAALVAPVIGLAVHGAHGGRGQVRIETCHSRGLMHDCTAVVTAWQGEGPEVGQRVQVLSRGALSGSVDVVLGTATESTTTKQQHDQFYDVHRIVAADAWIMPQWLRPIVFISAGIVWVVLAWGLARTIMMATIRQATAEHSPGAQPEGPG